MNEFNITLPHVRYLNSKTNHNPHFIYYKYIGNDKSLTKNNIYQFHHAMYSPSSEIKYKECLITQNDSGKYIIYEDARKDWSSFA
jgi:hypothetical protein